MGIIDEHIWITLNSTIIKYYESLGYEIPRRKDKQGKYTFERGTKIKVKVKDLPISSNQKVQIQCDGCGKIQSVFYNNYYKYKHSENGKYFCHECVMKMNSGKNHYHWNNSLTNEDRIDRRNIDGYTDFVKSVMCRDNYTCQCCGKKSSNGLEVHHLDGYNWYKEGRIDPANGITLCNNCHDNFHLKHGKGNNTKEQFEEWIGYALNELNVYQCELPTTRQIYCIEENKIYGGALIIEKEWGIPHTAVYSVCNKKLHTAYGKHLLWYDEYMQMSEEDIKKYLDNCFPKHYKKVVCLTTGKVFNTIVDAHNFYGSNKSGIIRCCKGKSHYAGTLDDGTKLHWMYYDDYLKTLETEQEELSDDTAT